MRPIKLHTKPIFRIFFYILKINRIMLFCNLYMQRPSYFGSNTSSRTV